MLINSSGYFLTHNQVVQVQATQTSETGGEHVGMENLVYQCPGYIENANSPIFVDGDWTSWNSTTFTLSVIKDCDDIEDDQKNASIRRNISISNHDKKALLIIGLLTIVLRI